MNRQIDARWTDAGWTDAGLTLDRQTDRQIDAEMLTKPRGPDRPRGENNIMF